MNDHARLSKPAYPEMRVARVQRPKRVVSALVLTVAAVIPASLMVFTPNAFAARNVNFVGTWIPSLGSGQQWTIKSENAKTGVCTGTTALSGSGYRLANCKMTGSKYSFWITFGAYKSHNTGTIVGNTLKGSFKDTNGSLETYTAKRKK